MSSPQTIFVEEYSMFAKAAQFLTSFNPDFHLDNSYLDVRHPPHVPSLFHRRKGQLPIIGENSPLRMDPLNWEYMYRPNRPFNFISNKHLRRSIPKLPPRPWIEREKQKQQQPIASSYLEEQAAFFNAIAPPLPSDDDAIADEDPHPPATLKVWVLYLWAIMITLGWLFVFLPLMIVFGALKWVGEKALRKYEEVDGVSWQAVVCALVAWKLVELLPGMEGKVEAVKEDAPLYVIMIRNPNQLFRGAVAMAQT